MPGGVNSPVRSMRSIGRDPIFIARGEGPHIWDVDGNRYVVIKMSDAPARVPTLAEARTDVVRVWKYQKAAELAKKRAEERLTSPTVTMDFERARIALLKALIRLQVASRARIRS